MEWLHISYLQIVAQIESEGSGEGEGEGGLWRVVYILITISVLYELPHEVTLSV